MVRLIVALALAFVSACQLGSPSTGCANIHIDWVDFVHVGSTQYVASPASPTTLQAGDLGPVVAHVKFKVAGNVCDPGYRPKDGDAAFLEPATPIYQVRGQPQSVMLAARRDGRIVAYVAKVT